jgi:hypothetical protein
MLKSVSRFGCPILVNSGLARVLIVHRCASAMILIPTTFLSTDSFLRGIDCARREVCQIKFET